MGQYFSRPPDRLSVGGPPIRTPLTDITAPIGHHDHGRCLPFNLRWADCMDAYGAIKGRDKCAEYYQDYMECSQNWMKIHRLADINVERKRQYIRGLVGKGPKVPLYSEHTPDADTFVPDFNMEDP